MKKGYLFFWFVIFGLCFSCATSDIIEGPDDDESNAPENFDYHLLFVGNSLTYTNNLPGMVKDVAEERGISLGTKMLANPNYAIIDHWADGLVQNLIESKEYDFVIIQQGPSSQPEGHGWLVNNGAEYAALCKENDAQLAYFMVWPALEFYHTFDGVIANYTDAAQKNKAILCPVGKVWKDHFDLTNDFSYYGPDDFHPSITGSKVAAEVIVNSLLR